MLPPSPESAQLACSMRRGNLENDRRPSTPDAETGDRWPNTIRKDGPAPPSPLPHPLRIMFANVFRLLRSHSNHRPGASRLKSDQNLVGKEKGWVE